MNEFVASYTDDHIFLSNVNSAVKSAQRGIDLAPLFANGLAGKIRLSLWAHGRCRVWLRRF